MAYFRGDLAMAWKGPSGDNTIWVVSPISTTIPLTRTNLRTDQGPALAQLGDRLYLSWKGEGGDTQIYVSSSGNGKTWTPPTPVGATTDSMPTMAVYDSVLYLAWKTPDQGLWMAWTTNGVSWGPATHAILDGGSSTGPSLTATRSGLALGWKGLNSDTRLFFARYQGGRWSPQQLATPNAHTSRSPSLINATTSGDELRFSWTGGLAANYQVFTAYLPASGPWTRNQTISVPGDIVRSTDGPAMLSLGVQGEHREVFAAWKDFVAQAVYEYGEIIVND
jgi:hypothetical protein